MAETGGLFGAEISKEFQLSKELVHLNHGSFGSVPRSVYEARLERMRELEICPDDWFRYNFVPLVKKGSETVSKLIGSSSSENVVFVENATGGVTAALRSLGLKMQPKAGLLVTGLSYEAIRHTAHKVCEIEGHFVLHTINLDPPYKDKFEVVQRYRDYLSSHSDVHVAIVDHITSPSTLLLPVKEIVSVCHEFGVAVIIDGAHAPGQVEINVEDINAEFYTGNLHKWFFCPRGCAFLHVRSDQKDTIRPVIASSFYHKGFPEEFLTQGTRDNTPFTVVPQAMSFYERLGGIAGIHAYCVPLLKWAADMMSERLGEPLIAAPSDMVPPYMRVVRFPEILQGDRTKAHGIKAQTILRYQYNITAVQLKLGWKLIF
ncbi:PREDICTED: putative L-cysteine desulfhydrase 1 [Amphimedon queenslandica]|uniref:Aminotransferase class V domain-containing protein n=1 Tax=Amphimedon queenslandica TaxID=400682 RepID=A0AAN0JTM7_AMPQE|nr:PREDICTED: putative L-cysteine desulfhydrase 1 [Amphimedon queenslandica]|eukprot:XP_019860468.1 PREDICTED: putative L-cysteine desulfhydrase 1 [Amphimedon queenslandica]